MRLLDEVKETLAYLHTCKAAYILAHAAWSACDHREIPGPSALEISADLDNANKQLLFKLYQITSHPDYSNAAQAEMLRWLDGEGYSSYVAKRVKTTRKKLVDW